MSSDERHEAPPLVGYQEYTDWMGSRVLTLADVWPADVEAMIVGLNPAPLSVAAGHYYQGRVGQRQLRRLSHRGVFGAPLGTFFEPESLEAGIGFTDLVKRPTPGEGGVSKQELEHGRRTLSNALADRDVPVVICVFRHPVEALLGTTSSPGWQDERTSWGARVFRLPGPFAAQADAHAVMQTLRMRG